MKGIALIGAGSSARKLIENYPTLEISSVYTTAGGGEFLSHPIQSLSDFSSESYSEIYIAIGKYEGIFKYFQDVDDKTTRFFWFDAANNLLQVLKDPFEDEEAVFCKDASTLTVIYDLRIAPPTFDFLPFLMHCDMEREKRDLEHIQIIFAPGDRHGFRRNIDFLEPEEMFSRIYRMLIPLAHQLNCKTIVTLCKDRVEARMHWQNSQHRFPNHHDFRCPYVPYQLKDILPRVRQGEEIQRLGSVPEFFQHRVNAWIDSVGYDAAKIVTITLRETKHHAERNSLIDKWIDFGKRLLENGYQVVFIRDTERCFEVSDQLAEFAIFDAAAVDMSLRRAIYTIAHFNFFTNNGAATLGLFDSNIRFIQDGLIHTQYGSTHPDYFTDQGLEIGKQHFYLKPWQRVRWYESTADELNAEFQAMRPVLNKI